jgi:hypothetical protein
MYAACIVKFISRSFPCRTAVQRAQTKQFLVQKKKKLVSDEKEN